MLTQVCSAPYRLATGYTVLKWLYYVYKIIVASSSGLMTQHNCFGRISDPTGVIFGIQLYKAIIARLFDPQHSTVKLKKIKVTGPATIEAEWSKEGFLQLPWTPYLTTQEGTVVSVLSFFPYAVSVWHLKVHTKYVHLHVWTVDKQWLANYRP